MTNIRRCLATAILFALAGCSGGTFHHDLPPLTPEKTASNGASLHSVGASLRWVPPPPVAEIKQWPLSDRRCRAVRGDNSCAAYVSVYTRSKGRSTASVRRAEDFIDIVVCYVSEPEYVDGNGTIWGSMVTCVEYIGDDGVDPFGYRLPGGGGGGGGGGVLPLPCSISGNFTINALVSGSPTLQSILAAVAAKYGASVNFNVIQGVGPNGMNAQSHYDTHTIDFYTNHSGDGAQIIEHEGLHLYNEQKDPLTGIRPNPFPGDAAGNFQSQRIVSLTDGTQLTFNIAAANGILNDAYTGYDHFIIHDQLIQLDGIDTTSALAQAFYQADSVKLPGGADHKMTPEEAKAAASTRSTTGSATPVPPPPAPAPLDGCNSTLSVSRNAQSTVRHTHALEYVDGYYINWDGEITL